MSKQARGILFVFMPLAVNILLAFSSFFLNPEIFHNHLWICYLTVAAAFGGSAVAFWGFEASELSPRTLIIALLTQSFTLIFVFAGVYRGYGLLYSGDLVSLTDDWQSSLYFSVVTWTTLGYGDFSPPYGLRLVAAIQALLGYGFFGISVGIGTSILCEKRTTEQLPSAESVIKRLIIEK